MTVEDPCPQDHSTKVERERIVEVFGNRENMGISNFPSPAEGILPVLVMNTVLSVALLKNMVRSVLQVMGASFDPPNLEEDPSMSDDPSPRSSRVSITRFGSLCSSNTWLSMECCVCLCGFKADEENHSDAMGLRNKPFPNYDDLCIVFGEKMRWKEQNNQTGGQDVWDISVLFSLLVCSPRRQSAVERLLLKTSKVEWRIKENSQS